MLGGLNATSVSGRQTSDCSSPTISASILVLPLVAIEIASAQTALLRQTVDVLNRLNRDCDFGTLFIKSLAGSEDMQRFCASFEVAKSVKQEASAT